MVMAAAGRGAAATLERRGDEVAKGSGSEQPAGVGRVKRRFPGAARWSRESWMLI